MDIDIRSIRNFCIIAHIDHGKSTLADRILELTGSIDKRDMTSQVLDKMDLERERGITIKLKPVRINYSCPSGDYVLNLIDTPAMSTSPMKVALTGRLRGRHLGRGRHPGCAGADSANLYLAIDNGLEIVPVVNKIDLPNADPERVRGELVDLLGVKPAEVLMTSAKTGIGVADVLEAVVNVIPPPKGDSEAPLRALIFDSHFDSYRGVIAHVRVFDGKVEPGDMIRMMSSGRQYDVTEVGVFRPDMQPAQRLGPGEVGFVVGQIKQVGDAPVGDTITWADRPAGAPLPGYRPATPMVTLACTR